MVIFEFDFQQIKKIFPEKDWDIGFLSKENLERLSNSPIKSKQNFYGYDLTSPNKTQLFDSILLARYCEKVSDYSFYYEAENLIKKYITEDLFFPVYLNFKEAALVSGMGNRAKNSLIYNQKFGFQCKFVAFSFKGVIVNQDIRNPSKELLDLCNGCDDCIKNCPVNAIHEDWIDSKKCHNFMQFGNHETIQTVKWFWYEKMKPNISKEEVESWTCWEEAPPFDWGQGIDGFYELNNDGLIIKDGEPISSPICNECQKQPKCSKVPFLT